MPADLHRNPLCDSGPDHPTDGASSQIVKVQARHSRYFSQISPRLSKVLHSARAIPSENKIIRPLSSAALHKQRPHLLWHEHPARFTVLCCAPVQTNCAFVQVYLPDKQVE